MQQIWEESERDQSQFVANLLKVSNLDGSNEDGPRTKPLAVVDKEVKLKLLLEQEPWSLNGPGTSNGLLVISGRMGSGKSQLALDLLAQLSNQGVRFVFFDLKGELEDIPGDDRQKKTRENFLKLTQAQYIRLIDESLPINPLVKGAHETENAQIASEMAQLIRAFAHQLGAKQERIIRECYQHLEHPDFTSLKLELEDAGEEGVALAIVEKIEQFNLFASHQTAIRPDKWLSRSIVIDFKKLGNDNETKSLAVALILNFLMKRLNRQLPPKNNIQPISMVLFVDEAHLLLPREGKAGLLGALARQGRSWGFPVWLASQDADAFLTEGEHATNFADLAECGIHFSPQTLTESKQRQVLGGVVHRDLKKGEAALRLQNKLQIGATRQFWKDGGK